MQRSHRFFSILFAAVVLASLGLQSAAKPFVAAGTMLRQAREMYDAGNFQGAVALADSVIAHASSDQTRIEAMDLGAKACNELGLPYRSRDYYDRSIKLFQNSGVFADEDLHDNADYRRLLINYSQFLLNTGSYDDCLSVLNSLGDLTDSEEYLNAGGLRSAALMRKGQLSRALAVLNKVMAREVPDANEETPVALLQNRGYLYLQLKEFEKAEEDLSRAVERADGMKREVARANLALAVSGQKDYARALRIIDEAVTNLSRLSGNENEDYLIALRKKGEILTSAGRKKEALRCFKEYYETEKKRLVDLLPRLTPNMRLNYWTMEKPRLSLCFLAGEEEPRFAFETALMRRETSLLASKNENFKERMSGGAEAVVKSLGGDEAAVAFILHPDPEGGKAYSAVTADSRGNFRFIPLFDEDIIYKPISGDRSIYDMLLSEDPDDKNRLYSDVTLAELVWSPILEALPEGIRKIHFAPEGVFHLWGIENMPLVDGNRPAFVRHFSLYDITEAESRSDSSGKTLLAGGLDYDDTTPSRPSHEDNPNREASGELRRAVSGSGGIFQYLPGTRREVFASREHAPEAIASTYLTEEDFKREAPSYRVIHLATHGYALDCGLSETALPADSLGYDLTLVRSGLALTGANVLDGAPQREDGILSAREICDLDLSDTELVILSACQTAKGLVSDESASGLVRALKMAGAKTVVASLWEVDDRSAETFMAYFHEALSKGLGRLEAFERARAATASHEISFNRRRFDAAAMAGRRSGESVSVRPFEAPWYWAPFIIIDP